MNIPDATLMEIITTALSGLCVGGVFALVKYARQFERRLTRIETVLEMKLKVNPQADD